MRRTITLVAAVAGLLLAGCSGGEDAAPPASSRPVANTSQVEQVDQETVIECANLERAYNAWYWESTSSLDWTQVQVERRLEDGEAFLAAAEGYTDQPALALALAIAEYNLEMSLIAVVYTTGGAADTSKAEAKMEAVKAAFGTLRDETCS